MALAMLIPECSRWRWRFERAHSKGWLIKGAFHLGILPRPGTPEMRQSSDVWRLTAKALMTPVYDCTGKNKPGNNRSGGEYSSGLTTSQDAKTWI